MKKEDAVRIAEAARGEQRIPLSWSAQMAELRLIALGGANREEPTQVRDLLAWVVRLGDGRSSAELALDERTGEIVRVERSR